MNSVSMKNQLSDSSLKLFEEPIVGHTLRLNKKSTLFSAVLNVTYEFVLEENVVRAIFDVYLKITHSDLCMMASTFAQGEKDAPSEVRPSCFTCHSQEGAATSAVPSKGAALLNHQGVYYDSGAPCETVCLSPSEMSGCSVYWPRDARKIRLLKSQVASA